MGEIGKMLCWCGAEAVDDDTTCAAHSKRRTEEEVIREFRYTQGKLEEIMRQRQLLKQRFHELDDKGRTLAREFNALVKERGAHIIFVKK